MGRFRGEKTDGQLNAVNLVTGDRDDVQETALLPPVSVSQRKRDMGTCLGKIALPMEVIYEAEVTKGNGGLSFCGDP